MIKNYFVLTLLSVWMALTAPAALAQTDDESHEDARLRTAATVLDELRQTPDSRVPDWLMQRAYGVAVVPEVLKGAFIFGGRYGDGVLVTRDTENHFGNPVFIHLAGGSFGFQVGATSTDVVLIFVTQRSVENFARGKFTLGADASVAAGPLGRQGEAAAGVNAEVYSYSRSRGLFAGVALDGTVLAFDRKANQFFYHNEAITTDKITSGKAKVDSPAARRFADAVELSTRDDSVPRTAQSGSLTPPADSVAAPAPVAPASAAAPAGTGVKTYPIEDPHPGQEPK
jgi:lipid-binding SYLF domain-containing protein